MKTKQIIGVFDDEQKVVTALKRFNEFDIKIKDIFGPFADHDILKNFTKRSRIRHLAFLFGVMAVVLTFSFVYFVTVIDYPLNFGGKPYFSFPPMVVIIYLVTILLTGTLTSLAMLGRIQLFPGKPANMIDPRILDDHFVMLFEKPDDPDKIKEILQAAGAKDIQDSEEINE